MPGRTAWMDSSGNSAEECTGATHGKLAPDPRPVRSSTKSSTSMAADSPEWLDHDSHPSRARQHQPSRPVCVV
eukprot:CAMPEP_0183358740 /NCGR_PEP_ID=MMETSP0164_2-20130417/50099_1 /TAXON_ID=221442 /ORGANISM="Coccolithus pelagicus ssp braarudi, Strain PLY182g" /LENGTH=72 /DNA_ID=CAMNT_0025532683 /DNA_START=215 /DNA_END=430 /DNA_ORIENTATION=-